MSVKDQAVLFAFFSISCLIGLLLGFVGFGIGLILLEPWQALGVFILSTGLGSLFAMFFGAKYLVRGILKGVEEAIANDKDTPPKRHIVSCHKVDRAVELWDKGEMTEKEFREFMNMRKVNDERPKQVPHA